MFHSQADEATGGTEVVTTSVLVSGHGSRQPTADSPSLCQRRHRAAVRVWEGGGTSRCEWPVVWSTRRRRGPDPTIPPALRSRRRVPVTRAAAASLERRSLRAIVTTTRRRGGVLRRCLGRLPVGPTNAAIHQQLRRLPVGPSLHGPVGRRRTAQAPAETGGGWLAVSPLAAGPPVRSAAGLVRVGLAGREW